MRKQTDISTQMRTILVDWLVEVGEEYKLHDETLHLAVNYIDRFLSQMSVLRGKLQLVGTACMYIARYVCVSLSISCVEHSFFSKIVNWDFSLCLLFSYSTLSKQILHLGSEAFSL